MPRIILGCRIFLCCYVARAAHVYLGCGSVDFHSWSCYPTAEIYYVSCGPSLTGTLADKIVQCSAQCSSHSSIYKAFSIQNASSCLCRKSAPSVKSTTITVENCNHDNIVYLMKESMSSNVIIQLTRGNEVVTWTSGLQARSSTMWQNWFLGRCAKSEATGCIADDNAWGSSAEIKTGDIVAWVNQRTGRLYSCPSGGCYDRQYPPQQAGTHLYRIYKADSPGAAAIAVGVGDDVYFRAATSWVEHVNCSNTGCAVSSDADIASSKFRLERAQQTDLLSSNAIIKLMNAETAVTLGAGMQRSSREAPLQNWFLGKCSGKAAGDCLGVDSNWVVAETIVSGDVVAWVNAHTHQALDCFTPSCMVTAYPPQGGYQGSVYRVFKSEAAVTAVPGTPISFGDEVTFRCLDLTKWSASKIVTCDSTRCGGNSEHLETLTFEAAVVTGNQATCAGYACPVGYSLDFSKSASTILTDANCCKLCDEFHTGPGSVYRGCQTRTRKGFTCQKWTARAPHTPNLNPANSPGRALGDHNFCRNADNGAGIWCYTTNESVRWDECDPLRPTSSANDGDSGLGAGWIVLIILSSVLCTCSCLVCVYRLLLRRSPTKSLVPSQKVGLKSAEHDAPPLESSVSGLDEPPPVVPASVPPPVVPAPITDIDCESLVVPALADVDRLSPVVPAVADGDRESPVVDVPLDEVVVENALEDQLVVGLPQDEPRPDEELLEELERRKWRTESSI